MRRRLFFAPAPIVCSRMSVSDLDIYRAANILVKEYGAEQAPLMAAKDAIVLDTTTLDAEAAFKAALAIVMGSAARSGAGGRG